MKKTNALANALRSSGATVAALAPAPAEAMPTAGYAAPAAPAAQPSRLGTKAITVHYPEEVRRQLKAMAAEQGRNIDDMVAEALNLVFARYRRPEIAPRKVEK